MIPDTVNTARTWHPRENKQVNPELEKKVGGQMKDSKVKVKDRTRIDVQEASRDWDPSL